MGNDPVTLYFSGRTLVGYCDDKQCVDALAEKRKRKEEIPAYRPAAVAEVSAWDVYGRPAISGCGAEATTEPSMVVDSTFGDSVLIDQLLGKGINITPLAEEEKAKGKTAIKITLPENLELQTIIEIPPVVFEGRVEGMEQLQLYLEISSDSTQISPDELPYVEESYEFGNGFGCYPGMINVGTTDPIADAAYEFIRLPVSITAYTLTDESKENPGKKVEVDINDNFSAEVGAVCGTQIVGQPATIDIPASYYNDGLGINGKVMIDLKVDGHNFSGNPQGYIYYLRILLKAEEM